MDNRLAIQRYIAEHGIEGARETFKLNVKANGKLVMLKYDQIESPFAAVEVQECRGLILHMDDLSVVSMPFTKFFNLGETHAHPIDWASAKVFKKYDGSLLTLYHYDGEWRTATTGTIFADTPVNNREDLTFSSLFWSTMERVTKRDKAATCSLLNPDMCYMFELCTPYNIVVTPHSESMLYLLAARNRVTLGEVGDDVLLETSEALGVPAAESYLLSSAEDMQATFKDMPFHEEGYVVRDANFNRVKIKNPAYVAAHHLKGSTAEHKIMVIIRNGEVEEYIATFPERADEILLLDAEYGKLYELLFDVWENDLCPFKYGPRKEYALAVKDACVKYGVGQFTGFFFSVYDGKTTLEDYLSKSDDKLLYSYLKAKIKEVGSGKV
jgi:RNA ligase